MTQVIKITKGMNIDLVGRPRAVTKPAISSPFYTVFPEDFPGLTPKVAVKEGDMVLSGTPVMYDKNRPEIKIVAPVSGRITAIRRGEKRRLLSIVIEAERRNRYVDMGPKVRSLTPEDVRQTLAEAGLLALIRQRPYDVIADPGTWPRDIFVQGFSSAPLAPDAEYLIRGREEDMQAGLTALAALVPSGYVYLALRPEHAAKGLYYIRRVHALIVEGPHPAGNASVQISQVHPVSKGETVWTIALSDVLIIGRLFNTGLVDMTRLVALTGSEVNEEDRAYYPMIAGAGIAPLVRSRVSEGIPLRYISGNVLTGTQIASDGALHARDNQVTVIPEGSETHDFLGWIKPLLTQRNRIVDARVKGGQRAMILSNEWDKVFPMDILPEFLIRAILAGDYDKMERLGIYEVAPEDFALCEYVDASKMELQQLVRRGLDLLYKEMNG
ncbi:MAG: Na(+)-translocating NADH-quinone reductase subunit A [Dysgonamonadaceae bacterium]|jgi:Na+-transporting NADH:ubiquinone oxidoreductase subunit A|nr:Na(+)-translocating NADH-quinone reductase subunit A [Dysgonamonadaceae bacterium]